MEEHNRLAADHEKRMAALGEEARLLRGKAEESRRGLEPHALCVAHFTLMNNDQNDLFGGCLWMYTIYPIIYVHKEGKVKEIQVPPK